MRDIHIRQKADREQQMKNNRTNSGRQYDSSKKLQVHRRPQPCMCLLNILRVGPKKIRWSPLLCIIQVMLRMTYKFLRWMYSTRVDGRESRQIKEVSDWFREEDAGDLKSSELNEYMTRRNAFEGKIGKICLRKSWKV